MPPARAAPDGSRSFSIQTTAPEASARGEPPFERDPRPEIPAAPALSGAGEGRPSRARTKRRKGIIGNSQNHSIRGGFSPRYHRGGGAHGSSRCRDFRKGHLTLHNSGP